MKRIVLVILCLICCIGFGCSAEMFDVSGCWYLDRMTLMEMDFPAEALGIEMAILLDEEGNGILTVKDSEENLGNREISYQLVFHESSVVEVVLYGMEESQNEKVVLYVLRMNENGELYAESEGTIMWFVRRQSEELP